MPGDFAYRKKQGFGAPIRQWLGNEMMKKYLTEKLGPMALVRKFLDGHAIGKYIEEFYNSSNKPERAEQRVWTLLCLELWAENNINIL